MSHKSEAKFLLLVVAILFIMLGWNPVADRYTWLLENVPILIAAPILIATYRRFPLSRLAYRLIAVHAVILMVGGHWTYADVPLGEWVMRAFDLGRNHYDRLGHFAQGFIPVIVVREFVIRKSPLKRGWMLAFLSVGTTLGFSAFYEFFEWWVAIASGTAAEAFLGTQGDVWDTQWDMFLATIGAIASLVLFSRLHDRHLHRDRLV